MNHKQKGFIVFYFTVMVIIILLCSYWLGYVMGSNSTSNVLQVNLEGKSERVEKTSN